MNLDDLGRNKCGESREVRGRKAQFGNNSLLVGTFFWPCPVSNEGSLLHLHIKPHSKSFLGDGLSAQCYGGVCVPATGVKTVSEDLGACGASNGRDLSEWT